MQTAPAASAAPATSQRSPPAPPASAAVAPGYGSIVSSPHHSMSETTPKPSHPAHQSAPPAPRVRADQAEYASIPHPAATAPESRSQFSDDSPPQTPAPPKPAASISPAHQ